MKIPGLMEEGYAFLAPVTKNVIQILQTFIYYDINWHDNGEYKVRV